MFLSTYQNAGSYVKRSLKLNSNALRNQPFWDICSSSISRIQANIFKKPSSFTLIQKNDLYSQLRAINRAKNGHASSSDFISYTSIITPQTFLFVWRDPLERLVSFYNFVRSRPRHYLHRYSLISNDMITFYKEMYSCFGTLKIESQYSMIKGALNSPSSRLIALRQNSLSTDLQKLKALYPDLLLNLPNRGQSLT